MLVVACCFCQIWLPGRLQPRPPRGLASIKQRLGCTTLFLQRAPCAVHPCIVPKAGLEDDRAGVRALHALLPPPLNWGQRENGARPGPLLCPQSRPAPPRVLFGNLLPRHVVALGFAFSSIGGGGGGTWKEDLFTAG